MSEEAEILNVENEKNTVLGWGAEVNVHEKSLYKLKSRIKCPC